VKHETRDLALRLLSLALLLLAVPGVIALGALSEDTAVVVDEPSPRTIVADRQVEVADDAATAEARQRAFNLVPAVEVPDLDASSGMVAAVGEVFAAARAAREPVLQDNPDADEPGEPDEVEVVPSPAQQAEQLSRTIPALDDAGVADLVGLSDAQLDDVEAEAVDVMQALAQRQILQDELEETLNRELPLLIGLRQWPDEVDETIALSAMYAANHLSGVAAIACMTASGYTPLIASRISSGLPIVGLAHNPVAQRRMALYRGVVSLPFDTSAMSANDLNDHALARLVTHGIVKPGDHVILTRGDHMNAHGGTNTMKILDVSHDHE
jgi:hypothetical protein